MEDGFPFTDDRFGARLKSAAAILWCAEGDPGSFFVLR